MNRKTIILDTKRIRPPCKLPDFNYPVTPKENLKLLFAHEKPYWVPFQRIDMQSAPLAFDGERPAGQTTGLDWFGQKWEFVDIVGGHTIAADSWKLEDPTDWENKLEWPDLDKYDFSIGAEEMEKRLDRNKIIAYPINNGMFERLLDLCDSTDALCFLLEEPESAKRYFNAMADYRIRYIQKLLDEWVPLDMIKISDDWGTQLNSFMSPEVYRDLIFEPTKRIFDFIHSKGLYAGLHSCGKIDGLAKYFVELGADMWEAQNNNNLEMVKTQFGKRLNLRIVLDPVLLNSPDTTDQQVIDEVHRQIEVFGKDGGLITSISSPNAHIYELAHTEMYRYSREFYGR